MMLNVVMLLVGALVAWVIGHFAGQIGRRLGLLDFPDAAGGRKLHPCVTPLVGGIAVVLALLIAVFATCRSGVALPDDALLRWLAIGVFGMFLIGAVDDRWGLTAPFRLGMAAALLLLVIVEAPEFRLGVLRFTGQPADLLLPGVWGAGFTLLCLVGLLNAVNMADGKNGLVIGQALVWAGILGFRLPAELLPVVSALFGALLVLFLFNMRGRLFLGDGGSYALSAGFGLLAIAAWNRGRGGGMRVDDIALLFALPVFDTLRLMAHRTLAGKTPFTAGRDHLHHYLHDRWGWPAPLPFVLGLVLLPNLGALLLPGTSPFWIGVTFVAYLAMLIAARARQTVAGE